MCASLGLLQIRHSSERYVMASTAVFREKSLSPAALYIYIYISQYYIIIFFLDGFREK